MDDSPIEQVRLTVPSTDDPTLQVLTFRIWILGVPLCILQSALVRIATFRQQFIYISPVCIDFFLYGGCNLLARVLPNKVVTIPGTRWSFSLNPCPFNIKEHIAIFALGYINTDSSNMWWPSVVASIPLYSIIPAYFFQSITALSFVCWIWKDSITAQQIGSGMNGLGIGSISLDWMTITTYDKYSKIYFTTSLLYCYAFSLAQYTSSISEITLCYGRSLWQTFKKAYKHDDEQDVHGRLMKQNYESIPQWWFYSILLSMIGMAILVCESFGSQIQLRYWEVLLACALVFLFLPLECVLEAIAGSGFTLDLLFEAIIGYLNPGKPLANMAFKLYGTEAHLVAAYAIYNFKLSHYIKIPPKIVFHLMILATISCFIDFGIAWWMLRSIDNICQPDLLPEGSPWTCPSDKAMFITGVTWGLVGPSKTFYPDGMYSIVFIFALIGLVAPIPVWLLSQKYPEKKWIRLINFPLIFNAALVLPVGGMVGYWNWFIVGLLFNYFIYHKHREWWTRYNYLLSAGLDAGSAVFVLLLSVSLQFQNIYGANWWGLELSDHCPLTNCPTVPGVIIEGCPIIQ
ncbi:hypothetical protein ZIOFF_009253 [Zingiber officinale]|uniref:Oligopeptide transporter n=1 Tax=Zingiber officinale TaxID=94328 RepID=A0A8J5HKT0_ZINOF|nr:hypothetical protein ZIOFF_009253 [Zingiber officinale]